jgi:probable phosphoglycerate mutase
MTIIKRTSFYFLRHGQTDWNAQGRLMGSQDIPLNETGIKQAHGAASALQFARIKTIAASPLMRARLTAEIAQTFVPAPIVFIDDLREACFGILEKNMSLNNFQHRPYVAEWRDGLPLEGAETYEGFRERARKGINKALELPGPVLIVAHGGIYQTLQQTITAPLKRSENCQLFICVPRSDNKNWEVKSLFTPQP